MGTMTVLLPPSVSVTRTWFDEIPVGFLTTRSKVILEFGDITSTESGDITKDTSCGVVGTSAYTGCPNPLSTKKAAK